MDAPAWSLAVLSSAFCAGLGTARAESIGRVAVIVVEGGGNDAVASQIAAHVGGPHAVRDSKPFLAALAVRGTRALAPAVGNRTADSQLIARAHAAATDAHVDVAILVAHRKIRRAVRGHLWVIDAHQEGAVVDQDLSPDTANDEADAVWTASASLFAVPPQGPPLEAPPAAAPPSPPATQDLSAGATTSAAVDRVQASPEGESASEQHSRRTALLVLQANLEVGSRRVSYVDRITPSLRPYDLFAAPLASIAAEVYPLARTGMPAVVKGLGVTGDYTRAFGLTSADAGGAQVGTRWQAYDFGVRDRVDLTGAVLLGVYLGYGAIDFDFDKPAFAAVLPGVGYRFLRAGVDLRTHGDVAVFGGGGYLGVLSTGNMGTLFPRESVGGVEARLGAAYSISSDVDLSLGVTYTRFFYSMHPQPGDANVAGGTLDEMARVSLGLGYLL